MPTTAVRPSPRTRARRATPARSRPAQRSASTSAPLWASLEDFYERFHTDIFNYHGSTIAEFLNEIRWGIHEYLLPEFRRSYSPRGGDPPRYEYLYPDDVSTELGKALYWDLMNRIRGRPCLERFQVTRYLKQRY